LKNSTKKFWLMTLIAVLMALFLAACGGNDNDATDTADTNVQTGDTTQPPVPAARRSADE